MRCLKSVCVCELTRDSGTRDVTRDGGGWKRQAQDAMGTLNLQKLLDLKEQGIEVESLLSLDKRTDLYAKEVRCVLLCNAAAS